LLDISMVAWESYSESMRTRVIKCSQTTDVEAVCQEAAKLLRDGQVIVFPTETVYGVGASAASREAVDRLQKVKGRPAGKPFAVLVAQPGDAQGYVEDLSRVGRRLMQKAWPGPLTLIADVPSVFDPERWKEKLPHLLPPVPELVFHDGTVGLRCPAQEIAQRVLELAGVPVVASSANRAGNVPPFDADDALRELDGHVSLVLDAGPTRYSAASTIVRLRGDEWNVVREGVLAERYLRKLTTLTLLFVCTGNTCRSPMAEALARMEVAQRLDCGEDELASEHGVTITSAGVFAPPGLPASEEACEEVRQRGGSLDGHRTQPLSVDRIREADAIFCMTEPHRQSVLALLPEAADRVMLLDPSGGDIADPLGGGPAKYRACADQIQAAVKKRMEERVA
jgi:tRNA threonylcarbamoyl adenosine modification protein (Sua5/YciO/YrdC/YwlC family)